MVINKSFEFCWVSSYSLGLTFHFGMCFVISRAIDGQLKHLNIGNLWFINIKDDLLQNEMKVRCLCKRLTFSGVIYLQDIYTFTLDRNSFDGILLKLFEKHTLIHYSTHRESRV